MVISDASTPEAFRREVLDEIGRRAGPLERRASREVTQHGRYACAHAARELRDLAAFLESVNFGKFPA
jgi:hypothetical protein